MGREHSNDPGAIGGRSHPPTRHSSLAPILLLAAIAAMMLVGLDQGDLRQDPLVYGAVSKQVWQSQQWDRLYFGADPYLNKPPLYFWVSAALFQIGGPTPAMARLASILPGFAFILLLFAWLKNRGFPPALAAVATLLVALCPVFLEHATAGRLETLYLLGLIGGCWTLDHTRLPTLGRSLLLTAFATIGWLTKGPAALVYLPLWALLLPIPGMTASNLTRRLWLVMLAANGIGALSFHLWWRHQHSLFGAGLMEATASREFVNRFAVELSQLSGGIVYYLTKGLVGFFPILVVSAGCWFATRRRNPTAPTEPPAATPAGLSHWRPLLWIAVVVTPAILPEQPATRYLLPALPALALLSCSLLKRCTNIVQAAIIPLAGLVIVGAVAVELTPIPLHQSVPAQWRQALQHLPLQGESENVIPSVGPPHWELKAFLSYYGGGQVRQVDPPELLAFPTGTWVLLQQQDFRKLPYLFDDHMEIDGWILARLNAESHPHPRTETGIPPLNANASGDSPAD